MCPITVIFGTFSNQSMLRRIMVSFPIVLLSYLGKMSKAKNGKFCLKLQILLILAYNADVNYIVLLIYYTTLVNKDIAICWVIADDEVNYIMQISQEDAILIKNLFQGCVVHGDCWLNFPTRVGNWEVSILC